MKHIDNRYKERYFTVYAIVFILLSLIPQTMLAVVETVKYSTNPLDIDISEIVGSNGETFSRVEWPGKNYEYSKEGAPELPCDHALFLVPQNTNNFRVTASISEEKTENRKLDHPLMPVQPSIVLNDITKQEEFVTADIELYQSAFMQPLAEIVDDSFIFGNKHIVRVAVHPVIYFHEGQSVKIFSELDLKLEYDYCDVTDLRHTPIQPGIERQETNEILSSMNLINKEGSSRILGSPMLAGNAEETSSFYYIIVPKSLEAGVQDIALWKRQKGYTVTVKTIESILSTSNYKIGGTSQTTGEKILDSACALRAYLQDEFKKNGVFFCLLVGDWRTNMPIRKSRREDFGIKNFDPDYLINANGSRFIPTDNYFSQLSKKWELENISCCEYTIPCEKGYYPDIFVGRLLCSNVEELNNYFYKLRNYESYPGNGDFEYLMNALYFEQYSETQGSLIGETLDAKNNLDIFDNITYIQDLCYKNSNEQELLPHEGKDIIAAMRRVGYSSWCGHGSPTSVQTCEELIDTVLIRHAIIPITSYTREQVGAYFKTSDKPNGIDKIDNINYPGIVFSIACTITPFDRFEYPYDYNKNSEGHVFDMPYNMGSAYTVAGLYGGVALIGNTREGDPYCSSNQQNYFGEQIKETPELGVAQAISKAKQIGSNVSQLFQDAQNLIGDPELKMWLSRPQIFSLELYGKSNNSYLTGNNLNGSQFIIYDGNTQVYKGKCGNSVNIPSDYWEQMPLFSIWQQGYIPFIRLFAPKGTFMNIKKRYMPHDAYLGQIEGFSFPDGCKIGSGAVVEINAMKHVEISDGFKVMDGGKVEITCNGNVVASGDLVKEGGIVSLKGENVTLKEGFRVEKGGKFQILLN